MFFTRRPGSGRPRLTSCLENRHIVQVTPSLGVPGLFEPYEGAWLKDISDRSAHYVCCPLRPSIDASIWSGDAHEETGLLRNEIRPSEDNRARVWRLHGERLNPAFALQRHTALTAGLRIWGAIAYNTWSPLYQINLHITSDTCMQNDKTTKVHDLLQGLKRFHSSKPIVVPRDFLIKYLFGSKLGSSKYLYDF
ncbi:UNVERIFIED_CONTAM: hypothetical protein NCL1_46110 [Trichonephila clavipes]